jgi:hypothetical protein
VSRRLRSNRRASLRRGSIQRSANEVKKRISKACIVGYIGVLIISMFLSAMPGEYWPWYVLMCALAVVPLILGPRWCRLVAGFGVFVSLFLIEANFEAARVWRAQMAELKHEMVIEQARKTAPNQSTGPTLTSGTPAAVQPARHP